MAPPKKPLNDRAVGEIMLTEVFTIVQRLNAAAGQSMVKRAQEAGILPLTRRSSLLTMGGSTTRVLLRYIHQQVAKQGQT